MFLTDILSCSINFFAKLHFRILWSILFCFTCYYGYLLYTPFLNTWNYEPTVIGIDQADFRVEKIPFPAITICSNNKIVYRQLESVLRTQPWRGLVKLNYNITQETTDKGMFYQMLVKSFLFQNYLIEQVLVLKSSFFPRKMDSHSWQILPFQPREDNI